MPAGADQLANDFLSSYFQTLHQRQELTRQGEETRQFNAKIALEQQRLSQEKSRADSEDAWRKTTEAHQALNDSRLADQAKFSQALQVAQLAGSGKGAISQAGPDTPAGDVRLPSGVAFHPYSPEELDAQTEKAATAHRTAEHQQFKDTYNQLLKDHKDIFSDPDLRARLDTIGALGPQGAAAIFKQPGNTNPSDVYGDVLRQLSKPVTDYIKKIGPDAAIKNPTLIPGLTNLTRLVSGWQTNTVGARIAGENQQSQKTNNDYAEYNMEFPKHMPTGEPTPEAFDKAHRDSINAVNERRISSNQPTLDAKISNMAASTNARIMFSQKPDLMHQIMNTYGNATQ